VPLGACAFGCKILKSRNVVRISTDVKMNLRKNFIKLKLS
jgi:hypothetical protein